MVLAVSDSYLTGVLDRLAQVAPVSYRRIFTGVGLYHREVQFALISNDRLYFLVDDASAQPYKERGMRPLQPEAALSATNSYYQVPAAVLEQPTELLYWMRAAVEAAQPAEKPEDKSKAGNTREASDSITKRHYLAG